MELMIVLVIAAVVLGLGAPTFSQFRQNSRMSNTANDALGGVVKARTEAIKRQRFVAGCPSANPNAAEPTCTDNATAGFIVFVDTDGTCLRATGGTEPLLNSVAYDHSMGNDVLTVKLDGNCLAFAPTGFRADVATRTTINRMLFCDKRGKASASGSALSAARGVVVSRTGRAKVTRDRASGTTEDLTTWTLTCP
jgi:Tfp pilus assembly protein FimT